MAMKHCSKCFEVLPMNSNYFYLRKDKKDGLRDDCKLCRKEYEKEYRTKNKSKIRNYREFYKNEHSDRIKETNRKYYSKNKAEIAIRSSLYYKQNRSEILLRVKKYRDKNKDEIKLYRLKNQESIKDNWKKYYEKNKERLFYKGKVWRKNNKDKVNESKRKSNQKRRSLERNLASTFTTDQWQQCLAHFNHQCAYCGSKESLEQEHVVPVSVGGHYTADNIIPACKSCNSSKNNKIMQDWFTQHENYSVERMANILKYVQKNKTEVNI